MSDESKADVADPTALSNLASVLDRLRRSTANREKDPANSELIGRYNVLGEVGRGGMGAIFKVRDEEMRRTLAMKVVLNPGSSKDPTVADDLDDARIIRFLEEAQVSGQLEHPGIVPVHELGLDEEGHLFFTMRLVKGRTLEDIFELAQKESEGWNLTRALGVIQKVCEAMAYAHEKHVMHRDLKPANIMVGRFGETYVMDWGLAKLLDREETDEDRREIARFTQASLLTSERSDESGESMASPFATLDGSVVGTPSYMAPEQAMGKTDEIGPSCDIFSAGAMLYHLLTGEMPYVKKGAKIPPSTVLQWVIDGSPKPIAELAPNAPGELVAICEKAMARDASARYGTMLELADEIRAFLEGRVVQAYETGAVAEFRKWIGRNRGFAAAASIAAITIVGALVWNGWSQAQANERLSKLNTSLDEAGQVAERARERAEASETEALASAEAARTSAAEAEWQGYAANIAAANASLDLAAATDARRRLDASPEEHRGWEWEHLSLRSNSALLELRGHGSIVWNVAFSPDGRFVASVSGNFGDTGGRDFSVRIWNAETGEQLHVLEGHTERVVSLAFSPSGTELATASFDETVRVWDVERGAQLAQSEGSLVAFHPEGDRILTSDWKKGIVSVWSIYNNTTRELADFSVSTRNLRISGDGKVVAIALFDGTVRLLDIESGRMLQSVDASKIVDTLARGDWWNGATAIDFDRTGTRLVTGGASGIGRVWNVETGELELSLLGHTGTLTGARFSPEGQWIVTSGFDGTLRFWDAETGEAHEVLLGHDGYVSSLDISPVGDRIVSGSRDKTLRIWDGQSGSAKTLLVGTSIPNFRPYGLTFSPDDTRLAWQAADQTLNVSNALTGELLVRLPTFSNSLCGRMFTSDGAELRAIDVTGVVYRFDAETGERLSDPVELGTPIMNGRPLAGGEKFLLHTVNPWGVQIYDFSSQKITRSILEGYTNWDAEVFDDGTRVLLATNRTIRAIDLETGESLFSVEAPGVGTERPFDVSGIAVHPTERIFVEHNYDSQDYAVRVRDLDTGELIRSLRGHAHPSCIDFHPDGSRVVTGNWDGTISLWDIERGEIASLRGPTDTVVYYATFDSTGERLVSTQGGRYSIWETTSPRSREKERRASAVRRWLEPKANALLDPLFEEYGMPSEVVAQLEADPSIDRTLRNAAIRLARSRKSNEGELYFLTRRILLHSTGSPDEYSRAMRIATYMQGLVIDQTFEKYRTYLMGIAQYRMGRYALAVESIGESLSMDVQRTAMRPDMLAFYAMAQAKSGAVADARETLDRIPTHNIETFYRNSEFPFEYAFVGVLEVIEEAKRVVEKAE